MKPFACCFIASLKDDATWALLAYNQVNEKKEYFIYPKGKFLLQYFFE